MYTMEYKLFCMSIYLFKLEFSHDSKNNNDALIHTDRNCVFSWENPNIGKIQIKAFLRDLNPKSMNPVIFMLQNSSNMTEIMNFANIGEFHIVTKL